MLWQNTMYVIVYLKVIEQYQENACNLWSKQSL